MKTPHPVNLLSEYLSYNPETGELIWRKATYRRGKAGEAAGTKRADGYISFQLQGRRVLAHRAAWALMTGEWPKALVDHRDGDPSNNRWENLREATFSENNSNSRGKDGACGVKNVYFEKRGGSFRVSVNRQGKGRYFGAFRSIDDARIAAESARKEVHGEFAKL